MKDYIKFIIFPIFIAGTLYIYCNDYYNYIVLRKPGPNFDGLISLFSYIIIKGWPFALVAFFIRCWPFWAALLISIFVWIISWKYTQYSYGPNCGDAFQCFMTPNFLLFITAWICHGLGRWAGSLLIGKDEIN